VLTMIPAGVGMAVLAQPIIRALLDHGDFRASAVGPTADTLRAFAIGLIFFSVYLYVIRTFSSMLDTRTPFLLNVVENGVNIVTAFAFYEWRGVEGLAWSWSLAYAVGSVVALAVLRRRLGRLDGRALLSTAARVVIALVPASAVVVGIDRAIGDATFASATTVLVVGGVAGTVVFVGVLQLLGIPLIRMIRDILRRDGAAVVADA
jgi:putative peptidoglycan lipid II flippase